MISGGRGVSRALALFLLLCAGVVGVEAALLVGSPRGPYWLLLAQPLTGLFYAVVGAFAWTRRPSSSMGALFCFGAVTWLAAGLSDTSVPALIAAGQVVATVPIAVVLHALLAFPSGRLTTRSGRFLTAAGYVYTIVLVTSQYLVTPQPPPYEPLFVADRPDIRAVLTPLVVAAAVALVLATAVVLVRRLVAGTPHTRRTLGPVYAYGAFALVGIWGVVHLLFLLGVHPFVLPLVQIILLAGVPVAFVAGVLRGGFARTLELQELATALGREPSGQRGLGRAMADTLGDPSLRLLFRVERDPAPAADEWVDDAGAPVGPPGPTRRRVPVEVGDRTVGAVDYDSTLFPDDTQVRAACGVVALAVGHERLTVELLAGREQLRESRLRLVESGDRERRRLAQDLHDRLQSRLVLLAITAAGPDGREAVSRGVDDAIDELRRIVQGVMPALLLERGLAAAVRDLAALSPLPVDLKIDLETGSGIEIAQRVPEPVESTAYLVVAEALTNTVKHASANRLAIRLERHDGRLRLRIDDDGIGGAVPTGAGLQGTIDRVTALEGSVRLDSPPGRGTRLTVEIPCVS
jgi:signal transduction histidine kinase